MVFQAHEENFQLPSSTRWIPEVVIHASSARKWFISSLGLFYRSTVLFFPLIFLVKRPRFERSCFFPCIWLNSKIITYFTKNLIVVGEFVQVVHRGLKCSMLRGTSSPTVVNFVRITARTQHKFKLKFDIIECYFAPSEFEVLTTTLKRKRSISRWSESCPILLRSWKPPGIFSTWRWVIFSMVSVLVASLLIESLNFAKVLELLILQSV